MNSGVLAGCSRDQRYGLVVEEAVGLDALGAEILCIIEVLDAGRGVEAARAHEGAIGRIERDGVVAAAAQRHRQAALDPARGDAGDEIGEAAERARGKAGQHVVLGHPARAAAALGQELSLLAVERLEVAAIARRHLDPWAWRMSQLHSSWIMMMCGRRPATWQESSSGTFSRSAVTASDSMKP